MQLFLGIPILWNWRGMMKIKFKTISPVILSPRMEKALYKGVDFKEVSEGGMKSLKTGEIGNINMVYPFYSYEDRNLLYENCFSHAKEYYIPASSLKGALLGNKRGEEENRFRSKILFKDIIIGNSHIRLRNLYKFQYLYQEAKEKNYDEKQEIVYKAPKFLPFFPSVAIEMLETDTEFESEILFKLPKGSEEFFRNRLEESFHITKKKLENYIKETGCRIQVLNSWLEAGKIKKQKEGSVDYIDKLGEIKNNIEKYLKSDEHMIFLGGYKGILGSLSQLDEHHKVQNGFYIDECTLLPYGLVTASLI